MTDPIIEFLEQYIDMETRAARSAMDAGHAIWRNPSTGVLVVGDEIDGMIGFSDGRIPAHMVLHDPLTVLVDLQGKLRIIDEVIEYERKIDGEWGCCHTAEQIRAGVCTSTDLETVPILRLLAARYSTEHGYRPEWRVEGLDNSVNGLTARILDGELGRPELPRG